MGKETISSQELSDYTHVNSTQIRRDLSGFGKFGKRGVGYNVDSPRLADPQDPAHGGQHNIALFGAGNLGTAIASSDIFADHGFRIVAVFDADPAKVGKTVGPHTVRPTSDLAAGDRRRRHRRRRPRRAHRRRPAAGRRLVEAGVQDHLQLLRGAPAGAAAR